MRAPRIAPVIPDPNYPHRPAQDAGFKVIFGLKPADKWPAAGMRTLHPGEDPNGLFGTLPVERVVRGVLGPVSLWVMPRRQRSILDTRRRPHRLIGRCPLCSAEMSAARLQQHAEYVHPTCGIDPA